MKKPSPVLFKSGLGFYLQTDTIGNRYIKINER